MKIRLALIGGMLISLLTNFKYAIAADGLHCDEADKYVAVTAAPLSTAQAVRRYWDITGLKNENTDTLIIGDSIAELWPNDLLQQISEGGTVMNLGIGRDRVENVLWQLDQAKPIFAQGTPRLVIVVLGTNNLTIEKPCGISTGMSNIFRKMRNVWKEAKFVYVEIAPRDDMKGNLDSDRVETNKQIEKELKPLAVVTVNLDQALQCPNAAECTYYIDGVHFSREGYMKATTQILKEGINQSSR